MSSDSELGFVPTRSSRAKQGDVPKFQEVVFSRYKAVKGHPPSHSPTKKGASKSSKLKDEKRVFMKKARFDIIKFGMTGFDSKKREESKQALAISLGAIPKKQKAINYKELKEQRKAQIQSEKLRKESDCVLNRTQSTKNTRSRKQSVRNQPGQKTGILDIYGKVNKKEIFKK